MNWTLVSLAWVPNCYPKLGSNFNSAPEREGDPVLHSGLTCNETWVQYFMHETKWASREFWHKDLSPLKKAKTTLLQRNLGPAGIRTLKEFYSLIFWKNSELLKLLKHQFKSGLCSKQQGWSVKSVCPFHNNVWLLTVALTAGTLEKIQQEMLPHPTYSPDTMPSIFHLLTPIEEALEGKKI